MSNHHNSSRRVPRRSFLRASGVSLALPLLDVYAQRGIAAPPVAEPDHAPHRMVMIGASMSLIPWHFFPSKAGADYESTPYLDIFKNHRERMTVLSGVSHPDVNGGHHADQCFLTAAPRPGSSGFRNTISVDQFAAERIGHLTREPSLVLHAGPGGHKPGLSWTGSGVNIPPETKPSQLYKRLFLSGDKQQIDEQVERLRTGRSILDIVNDRARRFENELGAPDRHKLDEYFTSIRELEKRMVAAEQWEKTPKPSVDVPMPQDVKDNSDILSMARLMYRMVKVALQSDSTRIVTLNVHSYAQVKIDGVEGGHHQLTHHGKRPEALEQLRRIEEARLHEFREFLDTLAHTEEADQSLLDRTMVMYGSHMGDANKHSNDNLPAMLIGGGFKHGQHLAFDEQRNYPLPNLYVSMLQRLGIETDRFSTSTGTMRGLEMASA